MRSEFQFINHIKERFSLDRVGDDCAVLPKDADSDLLITADLLIEDIDFRPEWSTPEQLGHKALAVSLSDIAAMGGTPTSAMLSIGVPCALWDSEFTEMFYEGWHDLASRFVIDLIGGDTSRSPDKLVIDSVVLGEVPRGTAILRSGARPGDAIFVSGTLGRAAGGLRLLKSGNADSSRSQAGLIDQQVRPSPQVELGKQLRELGIITAMIDISDGLSSDLSHICESSGVGAMIEAHGLPIDPEMSRFFPDEKERMDLALNGGEEFELLFTVDTNGTDRLAELPVTQIGVITKTGKVEISLDEKKKVLERKGFQHF